MRSAIGSIRANGPKGASGERVPANAEAGFEQELDAADPTAQLAQVSAGTNSKAPILDQLVSCPVDGDATSQDGMRDLKAPESRLREDLSTLGILANSGMVIVGTTIPNPASQDSISGPAFSRSAFVPISTPPITLNGNGRGAERGSDGVVLPEASSGIEVAAAVARAPELAKELALVGSGMSNGPAAIEAGRSIGVDVHDAYGNTSQLAPGQSASAAFGFQPAEPRRLIREDGIASSGWDVPKLELGAVKIETHRGEPSVSERGAAALRRDDATADFMSRPLTPVAKGTFDPSNSSGHSNSEEGSRGSAEPNLSEVPGVTADQIATEADTRLVPVRELSISNLSKALIEASDQLRSEASGQLQRVSTIFEPKEPAFVRSLSLEIQCDQGTTVRLRLSMHDDGLDISLAASDTNLMSMLNSERNQLTSMLASVGHNVVALRFNAFDPSGIASHAGNAEFSAGSGAAAGGHSQGEQSYSNRPGGQRDQDRPNVPRDRERSGLYV